MNLAKLVKAFDHHTVLPIEIPEVREEIIRMGIQDNIIFKDEDADATELRGVFYQFTRRPTLYGDPERCSLIVFSGRLSREWQRLVCCKELIHILDTAEGRTKTPEEVDALVERLLGQLSTEDFGLADFQAIKDKMALYQALTILFPDDARAEVLEIEPPPSVEEVAEWACLPVRLVSLVLSADWPRISKELLEFERE